MPSGNGEKQTISKDAPWYIGTLEVILNRNGLIGLLLCVLVVFNVIERYRFGERQQLIWQQVAERMLIANDKMDEQLEAMQTRNEQFAERNRLLGEKRKLETEANRLRAAQDEALRKMLQEFIARSPR